jgi:hypothetical protein
VAIEALLWSALGVTAPFVARYIPADWRERLGNRAGQLKSISPWMHGLAPPFLAIFSGAISLRFLGISGPDVLTGWILQGVLLAMVLAGASAWLQRHPISRPTLRLDHAVLDEPRWALYRGAGTLVLTHSGFGALLGLVLGVAEWALTSEVWKPERRQDSVVCLGLIRVSTSAIAFVLSRNLWLTIAFQVALLALIPEAVDENDD